MRMRSAGMNCLVLSTYFNDDYDDDDVGHDLNTHAGQRGADLHTTCTLSSELATEVVGAAIREDLRLVNCDLSSHSHLSSRVISTPADFSHCPTSMKLLFG